MTIQTIGVVGVGQMGSGIVEVCARAGSTSSRARSTTNCWNAARDY